ncbi:MAG: oligosaccharide flippase family protein [Bacteroidaceae bacterium]|nr:oligosaccharide flippase family protein [Bacteroidaceae bacterium]
MQDNYGHVLKYTGIFGGVQGLKILMDVVRNKLTSIILGAFGIGVNGIFQNIADNVYSATNFGLSFSCVRRLSELFEEGTEDELRDFVRVIRTWCLWSALLSVCVCLCLLPIVNDFYFHSGDDHRWEIVLLSFFVAALPIEAGECAILKGLRRLRTVATVEATIVVTTLLTTVPVYFLLGVRGVVLSLLLGGWAKALIHLYYTVRIYPYKVSPLSTDMLRAGWPLVRVGIPYVLAAVAGAMTTSFVYKSLHDEAVIGLYKACFALIVTYAGMVFVAVEADYFPRLSSVNHDRQRMNHLINQQIDVCVLLMAPLLIVLVLFMPWIVQLLYASEFVAIVPMAQCAVFYMFFKAITTPIAYAPLAKGHSMVYLVMECIYNIVFLSIMYYGYHKNGLVGAGLAFSAAALFDLLLIGLVYGCCYGYRMRMATLSLILPQSLLLLSAVVSAFVGSPWLAFGIGLPCLCASVAITWRFLSRESQFVQRLSHLFLRR